jgi:hypothetical protein
VTYYLGIELLVCEDEYVQRFLLYYYRLRMLVECFVESVPQLLFQIYILYHPRGGFFAEQLDIDPALLLSSVLGSLNTVVQSIYHVQVQPAAKRATWKVEKLHRRVQSSREPVPCPAPALPS